MFLCNYFSAPEFLFGSLNLSVETLTCSYSTSLIPSVLCPCGPRLQACLRQPSSGLCLISLMPMFLQKFLEICFSCVQTMFVFLPCDLLLNTGRLAKTPSQSLPAGCVQGCPGLSAQCGGLGSPRLAPGVHTPTACLGLSPVPCMLGCLFTHRFAESHPASLQGPQTFCLFLSQDSCPGPAGSLVFTGSPGAEWLLTELQVRQHDPVSQAAGQVSMLHGSLLCSLGCEGGLGTRQPRPPNHQPCLAGEGVDQGQEKRLEISCPSVAPPCLGFALPNRFLLPGPLVILATASSCSPHVPTWGVLVLIFHLGISQAFYFNLNLFNLKWI